MPLPFACQNFLGIFFCTNLTLRYFEKKIMTNFKKSLEV